MSLFCVKLHIPQSPDSAAHHRVGPASPPAPQPLTSSPCALPPNALADRPPGSSSDMPDALSRLSTALGNFLFLEQFLSSASETGRARFFYLLLSLHYLLREALPIYPLFYFFKSTPGLPPSFIFHNSAYRLHVIYLIICEYSDSFVWCWLCLLFHCCSPSV